MGGMPKPDDVSADWISAREKPISPLLSRRRRPEMSERNSKYTAQNLMAVHGLRAQAVVQERIAESRQQGDTSGLERWQNVEAAIAELRRTAPRETASG
jgi:hypothetical protein